MREGCPSLFPYEPLRSARDSGSIEIELREGLVFELAKAGMRGVSAFLVGVGDGEVGHQCSEDDQATGRHHTSRPPKATVRTRDGEAVGDAGASGRVRE